MIDPELGSGLTVRPKVLQRRNSRNPKTMFLTPTSKNESFSTAVDTDTGDGGIMMAETAMVKIKKIDLEIKNLISKEFTESASKLNSIYNSFLIEVTEKNCSRKKTFFQLVQEHRLLQYYCKGCAMILKKINSDFDRAVNKYLVGPLDTMLNVLISLSDNSASASIIISEQSKFMTQIIDVLENWYDKLQSKEITMNTDLLMVLEDLITLLYNVSMYDDNLNRMRSFDTIKAVQLYLDFNHDTIRLLSLATIADLVNESESNMIRSGGDVIEFLMATISNALSMESRSCDGWSLVELIRIIYQLAKNDSNKRLVVKHGAVQLLTNICQGNNVEEQKEAVKAIWRLSFDQGNKKEMLETKEWNVVDVLTNLATSSNESVRRISNKALWTIIPTEKSVKDERSYDKAPVDTNSHIMISYNWGHQSMAKQIRDELKNTGIRVWMDVDNMQGSTIDAMSNAVEKAYAVLVCYSYKYKTSDNCRAEAEYAYKLKKKIVPVQMETGYKADGWLGFIIGAKLFFDFSGKYPFQNKIKDLIRELSNDQNQEKDSSKVVVPVVEPSAGVMSSTTDHRHSDRIGKIMKWSDSQVGKWLANHDLPHEKIGALRGKDVAFLCLLLQESPDNFYRILREQFNITDITNVANLRFALYQMEL